MSKQSKRQKLINSKIEAGKAYQIDEALNLLKDLPAAKFDQSIEVVVNLGIDAKKSDQNVRGSVVVPNGLGKTARVAVFAQGQSAEVAKSAGADIVGFEDLAEQIKAGVIDFDIVIATPDAMKIVGMVGQILGPRGLMPNPKVGTVTNDVATAVNNAKKGQVRFKNDKAGILHFAVGKLSFAAESLKENIQAVIAEIKKLKPATSKGIFVRKIYISSTMGPGLLIEESSLN